MKATEYDKQDQQGKAALNECNPHTTQQQEPVVRSPGGPKIKTGQDTRQSTDKISSLIIYNKLLFNRSILEVLHFHYKRDCSQPMQKILENLNSDKMSNV
jgi:hypothetical protein